MRSLKARFHRVSKDNPLWSSFVSFTEAIKDQRFSSKIIYQWFDSLVDKDDYSKQDKRAIFSHLLNL
jgi:hypothetical protein